jgi:large subunit ribosomal protein L17
MKHGKKINHLGRTTSHRKAMLANMACSLIEHKRINTTVAKAKALKLFVEPIITKAKDDTTHNRRTAFRYLRDKYAVTELFRAVIDKIGDRPGGYTRIIRTGNRLGDNAEMCLIELVDFNEIYTNEKSKAKSGSRRSRRGGSKKATPEATAAEVPAKEVKEETKAKSEATAPKAEAPAEEKEAKKDDKKEE